MQGFNPNMAGLFCKTLVFPVCFCYYVFKELGSHFTNLTLYVNFTSSVLGANESVHAVVDPQYPDSMLSAVLR